MSFRCLGKYGRIHYWFQLYLTLEYGLCYQVCLPEGYLKRYIEILVYILKCSITWPKSGNKKTWNKNTFQRQPWLNSPVSLHPKNRPSTPPCSPRKFQPCQWLWSQCRSQSPKYLVTQRAPRVKSNYRLGDLKLSFKHFLTKHITPPKWKKSNSLVASINHQCPAVPETQLHKEIEPVEYDLFTEQRVACKALMKLFRSCSVKGLLSIWGKRNWSLVSLQTCSRIGLSGDEFATPSESVLQAHDFLTHLIWFAN